MQRVNDFVKRPIAIGALLVLLGVTAHAGSILIFTSLDEYQSRVGGVPNLAFNFNAIPVGPADAFNFGQMIITGPDMFAFAGAINFGPGSFAMNFGGDIFAFGAQFTPVGGGGFGLINFSAAGISNAINVTSPGFIGFISDTPFRSFAINFGFAPSRAGDPATYFVVDNVIANTVVPEPTTLALLATGAGLAALSARRRKRQEPGNGEAPAGDDRGEPPTPTM